MVATDSGRNWLEMEIPGFAPKCSRLRLRFAHTLDMPGKGRKRSPTAADPYEDEFPEGKGKSSAPAKRPHQPKGKPPSKAVHMPRGRAHASPAAKPCLVHMASKKKPIPSKEPVRAGVSRRLPVRDELGRGTAGRGVDCWGSFVLVRGRGELDWAKVYVHDDEDALGDGDAWGDEDALAEEDLW